MPVDTKTLKALDLSKLAIPASLPIEHLEVEEYAGPTGEETMRILVVLNESVDIARVSGRDVGQLKEAIRESLRNHGITVFPYFKLAKRSELAELDDLNGEE